MKNNNKKVISSQKTSVNNRNNSNKKALSNRNNINSNVRSKNNNNKAGFDIYDPKNAVEFNRQFLGLGRNWMGGDGMFVGGGIFNMNLPMHRRGEAQISNPYGNNFYGNNKGTRHPLNPRTKPLEYLQQFFGGFGIEFPVKELMRTPPTKHNNNYRNNKNASAPKKLIKNNNDIQTKNKKPANKKQSDYKNINVYRYQFYRNIFNNNTITNNEDLFRDNYCSNFSSNLEKEVFDYLMSLINGNRVLSSQQKQTPIRADILKKLNRFDMNEKYMKKSENSL